MPGVTAVTSTLSPPLSLARSLTVPVSVLQPVLSPVEVCSLHHPLHHCSPSHRLTAGSDALSVYRVSSDLHNTLPLVEPHNRDTEILMIDHVRAGLDVMLMCVCLILLLMIGAFILHKH